MHWLASMLSDMNMQCITSCAYEVKFELLHGNFWKLFFADIWHKIQVWSVNSNCSCCISIVSAIGWVCDNHAVTPLMVKWLERVVGQQACWRSWGQAARLAIWTWRKSSQHCASLMDRAHNFGRFTAGLFTQESLAECSLSVTHMH